MIVLAAALLGVGECPLRSPSETQPICQLFITLQTELDLNGCQCAACMLDDDFVGLTIKDPLNYHLQQEIKDVIPHCRTPSKAVLAHCGVMSTGAALRHRLLTYV